MSTPTPQAVVEWETFWIDLLRQYEEVCDQFLSSPMEAVDKTEVGGQVQVVRIVGANVEAI